MLKRLYNSWHIADPGERSADKLITSLDGEIIHIIHHLRISSFYHRTQLAGEIDFLVLTRLGLMVIEVKGGEIGYGERTDGTTGYFRLPVAGPKRQWPTLSYRLTAMPMPFRNI